MTPEERRSALEALRTAAPARSLKRSSRPGRKKVARPAGRRPALERMTPAGQRRGVQERMRERREQRQNATPVFGGGGRLVALAAEAQRQRDRDDGLPRPRTSL